MIHKLTKTKSTLFMDLTENSYEEVMMTACHKREIVGNVAILTTYL